MKFGSLNLMEPSGPVQACNMIAVPLIDIQINSSVSIENLLLAGGSGIESRRRWDFSHLSRPALGPTQPPIQLMSYLLHGCKVAGA